MSFEWDDSPGFGSFIQHALLVLTLEAPTKKKHEATILVLFF